MTPRKFTRRDFLKTAGIALGASALTCSGLGYLATLPPEFEMTNATFGEQSTMSKKILITYATKAGSTVEIAAVIGESLSKRGFAVDVKPVSENPALDGYQAVLMGSAIRMGSWLPEAVDFIRKNQSTLQQIPTSIFTVHMLNYRDDEASRTARQAYTAPVRELLPSVDEVFFRGKLNYKTLSFFDRMIAKAVANPNDPPGDFRDWDQIRDWAENLNL
ncbi:MAG: flavodoxin domain-containing protein [Chloroflexi bacterium]|nr:flavodoxin domain-containing protein [Chloroflexota bacterium]